MRCTVIEQRPTAAPKAGDAAGPQTSRLDVLQATDRGRRRVGASVCADVGAVPAGTAATIEAISEVMAEQRRSGR